MVLTPQVGDGASQDPDVEQDLLIFACHVSACTEILFHTDNVAVHHHAVLIVCQTHIGVERGIEEEREAKT